MYACLFFFTGPSCLHLHFWFLLASITSYVKAIHKELYLKNSCLNDKQTRCSPGQQHRKAGEGEGGGVVLGQQSAVTLPLTHTCSLDLYLRLAASTLIHVAVYDPYILPPPSTHSALSCNYNR